MQMILAIISSQLELICAEGKRTLFDAVCASAYNRPEVLLPALLERLQVVVITLFW